MPTRRTIWLPLAAVVANGLLVGASLDQSIKQLPARHRIGPAAFAAYSQAADLRNGIPWYATLGLGTAALTLAAAYRHPEIAAIIGKSQDNVRQLATRARRHLAQRRPRFQTTREQRDELARRFLQAVEQGDLSGLEALLANDVELAGDGGGKVPALARTLRGRSHVARTLIDWARLAARAPGRSLRPVEVNGGPGALYLDAQQRLIAVVALDIAGGQVTSISAILNTDKLTRLGPVADFGSLWGSAR